MEGFVDSFRKIGGVAIIIFFRESREGGHYRRSFELDVDVERDAVGADYADGVLTLSLPKAKAARAQRIEVKRS